MGMKMNGNIDFLAKSANELKSRVRLAKAGHVFDGQEMRPELFQLLGHGDVIFERIFWAARIENVAGVANGRFADRASFEHSINGHAHVFDGVERIENAKDVDTLSVRFAYEFFDDIIGIGRIAHSVCAAEEHLEADIGYAAAQLAQAQPGIFVQEAERGVEGGATPHFQAEKIGKPLRDGVASGQEIVRAHAGGHERLVRIAKGGVRDQQALFFTRPGGKLFRAKLLQQLSRTRRRLDSGYVGEDRRLESFGNFLALYLRIAVEDYIAEIGKQFGGAIAAARNAKEFGRVVEKRSSDFAGAEPGMIDDILEERNVGLDAANAKFAQSAIHTLARFRKIEAPGGDFHEERIVIGGKDSAGIGGAAVKTNAESRGRAVSG